LWYPYQMNTSLEKRLFKKGYQVVIGLDEAGRGPLAGPVVAGAAALTSVFKQRELLQQVKDSKKLSAIKREQIYKLIVKNKDIKWAITEVSHKVIDKINILQATKLAMQKAVLKLSKFFKRKKIILIIDGNQKIKSDYDQLTVVKGDNKVFLCACASILAKVYRDRKMQKYHKEYPKYGFDRHKGYPTKKHYLAIKKHGLSPIHRKSFSVDN